MQDGKFKRRPSDFLQLQRSSEQRRQQVSSLERSRARTSTDFRRVDSSTAAMETQAARSISSDGWQLFSVSTGTSDSERRRSHVVISVSGGGGGSGLPSSVMMGMLEPVVTEAWRTKPCTGLLSGDDLSIPGGVKPAQPK